MQCVWGLVLQHVCILTGMVQLVASFLSWRFGGCAVETLVEEKASLSARCVSASCRCMSLRVLMSMVCAVIKAACESQQTF